MRESIWYQEYIAKVMEREHPNVCKVKEQLEKEFKKRKEELLNEAYEKDKLLLS